MTKQYPTEMPEPDESALRLARIRDAHGPDEFSGIMCAECGYLAPCPTRRMADGTAGIMMSWRQGQVVTGALVPS